jgi:hypothetical protein
MGFNTEVKYNGVVYHVQTEPRKDSRIETMVYLRGAIIHSLKTSYEALRNSPDYSEEKVSRLLKDQHQLVIGRVLAGQMEPSGAAPAGPRSG